MKNPFRYFKTSPEVIRLAVMMYVRFPLSLRNVEDLLHERGIRLSANENEAATLLIVNGSHGWRVERWVSDLDFGELSGTGLRRGSSLSPTSGEETTPLS